MVAVAVLKSCHFWAAILFWNRPFLVPNYVIATTVLDFLSTPLFIQLSYLICYKKKFRNLKDNVSFGMILQGVIRTPKHRVQAEMNMACTSTTGEHGNGNGESMIALTRRVAYHTKERGNW
ncbi:hypothetical protein GCK72_019755 [Caenorhabditis remanei]|uniref:Serpentine receptor class gamma n=1 Tax=Caenorhabditis remanei TaxID=31234 RepID=A0A6A5GFL2_CAERE|nr:hypothetical protein GCK72_019755 [Caenorhabditis remanei]KAF1753199.1 hypothetical protein GCK72_019755 [Caenorhabditis remanei]